LDTECTYVMRWVRVGGITGLAAAVIYPLMISVSLPLPVLVILTCAFGPLLTVASLGLYQLLKLGGKSVSLQIATVSNVVAGTIVNMMMVVQLAVRHSGRVYLDGITDDSVRETVEWVFRGVNKVHLGLDVSWDVYIALGTFLFALNMLRHPRFGRVFGWIGMVTAAGVMYLNLSTFPTPPGEAGLVDLGPLMGLWYMAVGIQALRSLGWVEKMLSPYFDDRVEHDFTQIELEIKNSVKKEESP